MQRISSENLTRLAKAIIGGACGNETAAAMVAHRLVLANLMAHDSHGVGMLPAYVAGIKSGQLNSDAHAKVVQDNGPFLLIDGQCGFGQVVAEEAMELAIDRARNTRFALMSLRNSFHIGRVGDWATMAAEAGFIAIQYVNVLSPNSLVAPFGGSQPRFATNPYCTAIPKSPNNPMLLLDMATSAIAQGKTRVAYLAGNKVPDNCLIDSQGHPTNDPAVMFEEPKGALTTMGQHKGFGLAVLCDLLGGSLSGGGAFIPERVVESRIINNMLTILIDPDVFGGADAFFEDIDKYTGWVKSSPPAPGFDSVMIPGDPERKAQKERSQSGIPIDDGTWGQLVETATSVGLTAQDIAGLIGDAPSRH